MSNIKLTHHDDGKGKLQSHEVGIKIDLPINDIYSINPEDMVGYGSNKEEALEQFADKTTALMNIYSELYDAIIDGKIPMIEIDCMGNEVNNSGNIK